MIYIGLIILVNLLFYLRTIDYAGICDDIPIFNLDRAIPKRGWMYFWYHLKGYKYESWKLAHCQSLAVHTINCVLIYIVFGMNYTSLIAALLFSVNPINNQCSVWLSGRQYSLNTSFAMLMWYFPLASPLFYLFATYFCGASIILFPFIFLFTKYFWLISLILLGIWREHQRIFNTTSPVSKYRTESNTELLAKKPRKLIVVFKTLGYYFINSIFALKVGFYHNYLFLHGVSAETNKESYKIDKYFFIGIGVILLTLITRHIGLLWFCITLGMWLNFISFNQTISNRYVYLPNVGLTLFISSLLIHYPPLALVLFTYYATKLSLFLYFFKNEYWAIEHSCIEQPDFFYPWQNRSVHCFQNGNYQGALANMIKADQLRPNDWKISYDLCQIYILLGNLGVAKQWYDKAKLCKIDGREDAINHLMDRLAKWLEEIEAQAKANNNNITVDIKRFDMQR